ncbi:MAG TPA: hypothetical protein VFR62_10050 [Gemmatimonadales bacterium]|nr:hypothetical protein [Gemmatimonadales bacterium]
MNRPQKRAVARDLALSLDLPFRTTLAAVMAGVWSQALALALEDGDLSRRGQRFTAAVNALGAQARAERRARP